MKNILIGGTLRCNVSRLVDTRLLIQANSGGGKSWLIRRLLEQTHGSIQHLVIDPEGEFASLRERYDYVLAARHGGDTAADPRVAGLLAERLLELRVSAILDIYELKHHERIRFVKTFLHALVNAPKRLWHPVLVVVDEAHIYCPEKGKAESTDAVIDLATRGRKRGFCAVLATQRLSKLHKDAAAECNNKLIGRTGLDIDMKRAGDELGFGKEDRLKLRNLKAGDFFAFGPALSQRVIKVRVGGVRTTHPKAGSRIGFTPPPASAKVKRLLPKLADLPAEVEEKERSVANLKRDLAAVRRELTQARNAAPTTTVERVEIPVIKGTQLTRLDELVTRVGKHTDGLHTMFGDLGSRVDDLQVAIARARDGKGVPQPPGKAQQLSSLQRPFPKPLRQVAPPTGRPTDASISRSQQRILDTLVWLEAIGLAPVHKTQVAIFAGNSPTSGGYANNLGRLRSRGLIEYPQPAHVELLEAGRDVAVPPDTPVTNEELHAQLQNKLPRSQWAIVQALIDVYPDSLAKSELAEIIGQSPTSGGYANNLGRLRSLGLIDYPVRGHAVANPVLFLNLRKGSRL